MRDDHAIVGSVEGQPVLDAALADFEGLDLCIYCADIGEPLELPSLEHDLDLFSTNLMGAVKA